MASLPTLDDEDELSQLIPEDPTETKAGTLRQDSHNLQQQSKSVQLRSKRDMDSHKFSIYPFRRLYRWAHKRNA